MERFEGKIAVVTGGASGMGRELVRQLAAEGCHVALCDLSIEEMGETRDLETAAGEAAVGAAGALDLGDVSAFGHVRANRAELRAFARDGVANRWPARARRQSVRIIPRDRALALSPACRLPAPHRKWGYPVQQFDAAEWIFRSLTRQLHR